MHVVYSDDERSNSYSSFALAHRYDFVLQARSTGLWFDALSLPEDARRSSKLSKGSGETLFVEQQWDRGFSYFD